MHQFVLPGYSLIIIIIIIIVVVIKCIRYSDAISQNCCSQGDLRVRGGDVKIDITASSADSAIDRRRWVVLRNT